MGFLRKREIELMTMVLRFSGGSVFLWFGIDKWIRPEAWYAWMPAWVWPMSPLGADRTIIFLGVFEFAVGLLLVMGRYVRMAAVIAVVQLSVILAMNGIHEVAVRDAGLLGVYLALIVEADRRAERRIPPNALSWAGIAFVIVLFLIGLLYLKSS